MMLPLSIILCLGLGILFLYYQKQLKKITQMSQNVKKQRMPIAPAAHAKANSLDAFKTFKLANLFIPEECISKQITALVSFQEYYAKRGNATISKKSVETVKALLDLLQTYCNNVSEHLKITDNSRFDHAQNTLQISLTLVCTSILPCLGRFGGSVLLQDFMDRPLQQGIDFECQFAAGSKIVLSEAIKLTTAAIHFKEVCDSIGNIRPEALQGTLQNGFRYKVKLVDKVRVEKTVLLSKTTTNFEDEFSKIMGELNQ